MVVTFMPLQVHPCTCRNSYAGGDLGARACKDRRRNSLGRQRNKELGNFVYTNLLDAYKLTAVTNIILCEFLLMGRDIPGITFLFCCR